MDLINILEEIIPKMKLQMYSNKDIYSIDEVYFSIAKFDKLCKGICPIPKFENFLSTIGVYLKTQELSEIYKYIAEDGLNVVFEKFIMLFRKDVPYEGQLIKRVTEVYNKIKNPNGSLTVEDLKRRKIIQNHPLVKVYKEDENYVNQRVDMMVKFVLGDKTDIEVGDLIEYYKNVISVMPEDRVQFYIRNIPEFYGLVPNDF